MGGDSKREYLAAIRQLNRICDRFESAWQSGEPPRIDDYLQDLPPEIFQAAVPQLVALEIDYRKLQGESPSTNEYSDRFASLQRAWLDQLCTGSETGHATQSETLQKNAALKLEPGTRLGD